MKNPHLPHIRKAVAATSTKPGVYRWLNEHGEILYIGKAKNLRSRLKSYLPAEVRSTKAGVQQKPDASLGPWKLALIEKIAALETTITHTELEALVLETNLIKEHKPRYNVMMKDDKHYVYVEVNLSQAFPEVEIVRKITNKKAKYFGPYLKKKFGIERVLDMLQTVIDYRSDQATLKRLNRASLPIDGIEAELRSLANETPPLEYQIGKVNALCIGKISQTEYRQRIDQLIRFLQGDHTVVLQQLQEKMRQLVAEQKFEDAATLRDALRYIQEIQETQLVSDTSGDSSDIIALALYNTKGRVVILQERGGKVINEISRSLRGEISDRPEAVEQFLQQYYSEAADIPDCVVIEEVLPNHQLIQEWLCTLREKKVELRVPERGKKRQLLNLTRSNAEEKMKQEEVVWETAARNAEKALEELQRVLQLPTLPARIEGYDISHTGGTSTVGSMVVLKNGKASNDQYRSFTIQSLADGQVDDYAALGEVLRRRLTHLSETLKQNTEQLKEEGITIGKVLKKEQESFGAFLSTHPELYAKSTPSTDDFFVARNNKKIIGCACLRSIEGTKELTAVWIDDEYKGKKIEQTLIKKLLKNVKKGKVYLRCRAEDEASYGALGFRHVRSAPAVIESMTKAHAQKNSVMMMFNRASFAPDSSLSSRPDLIVLDGGKGQLSTVVTVMKELEYIVPVIGLAKREEEVFVPRNPNPVVFGKDSQAKFLLMRLRNEAHRFANKLRKSKQSKLIVHSALDDISGIGPEAKQKLLSEFGSLKGVKEASDEELREYVSEKQLKGLREGL